MSDNTTNTSEHQTTTEDASQDTTTGQQEQAQTQDTGQHHNADTDQNQTHPWDNPDTAKAEIERLRRENARDRTTSRDNAAQQAREEISQQIGKALGIIDDTDSAPDPAKLTEQVEQARNRERQAIIELAVHRSAIKHGADPEALLDSRAFINKLGDLDPTGENFAETIETTIADAVDNNPRLRSAGQVPNRSGGELNNGQKEAQKKTPEQLADLIRGKNRF
ncbi:hypothetical protein QDX21_03465 [Auritidibacter ignavus]|uniref:Uncharacterized protein n=1 Tax=Auritidibacter ignavus TaxID=678932 RepID=A0AAJ6DCP3_9MICC|nr:hypothetical protein [Auritidibacter ignavus]WGH93870.1 hypothetical protein QDX21_03465 [Auritidibacter ignavus]